MKKYKLSWTFFLAILGFAFLYIPIIMLIVYSFNESKLVTVWSSFSTKWYTTLWQDDNLIAAFKMSLKIAIYSSIIAVLLGTIAGFSLSRFGLFFGRSLFSAMLSAPFIIPEVITGFSVLLLYVTAEQIFGFPKERGLLTITITHATLCMAYVAVIVQARLSNFNRSLEEAALDLGAKPIKVFFLITLPLILPSIIAGMLLSFTLSFDDLVLASFTSGPGSTTMPMLIYSRVRLGLSPEINALATIIISIIAISAIIIYNMTRGIKSIEN